MPRRPPGFREGRARAGSLPCLEHRIRCRAGCCELSVDPGCRVITAASRAAGQNRHSVLERAVNRANPETSGGFVPICRWTICRWITRATATCHPQAPEVADANWAPLPIVTGVIDLDELLAAHSGVLLAREHRPRKSSLSRWCRAGRLVRLLPGVYVHPAARDDLQTRLRALMAKVPDAVMAGDVAARLTAWPEAQVGVIEVVHGEPPRPEAGLSVRPAPGAATAGPVSRRPGIPLGSCRSGGRGRLRPWRPHRAPAAEAAPARQDRGRACCLPRPARVPGPRRVVRRSRRNPGHRPNEFCTTSWTAAESAAGRPIIPSPPAGRTTGWMLRSAAGRWLSRSTGTSTIPAGKRSKPIATDTTTWPPRTGPYFTSPGRCWPMRRDWWPGSERRFAAGPGAGGQQQSRRPVVADADCRGLPLDSARLGPVVRALSAGQPLPAADANSGEGSIGWMMSSSTPSARAR